MALFDALFGSPTSDAAQKARQDALNAFNAVQTPALSALQVQLQKEVVAGTLTPEQASAQLINSNAFNQIATDPSLVGAQKQAIQQLQQIGTQGGLTAVDKAQLNDINNAQNQQNQSQNQATMQQAQQRGMGNSGINQVNQLVNEQGSADRAANSGLNVAAQAQARALQALQGAGSQAGALQQQEYGQAANAAQAQNAIDLFNKQTLNSTNLYNVQAANQAQAANVANQQNVANTNTGIANTQAETNAQAAQQQYQDALTKAQGVAGVDTGIANAAQNAASQQYGANVGLTGGLIQAGAKAGAGALAGPAAAAIPDASGSTSAPATYDNGTSESDSPYSNLQFAEGGRVEDHPDHPMHLAMGGHVHCYAYGGDVSHHPDCYMAEGGETPADGTVPDNVTNDEANQSFMQGMMDRPKPSMPVEWDENNRSWDLRDKTGNKIGSFANYSDALDFADKVSSKNAAPTPQKMAKGGKIGPIKKGALHKQMGVPQGQPMPAGRLEKATHSDNELLRKRAQFAENAKHWNHAAGGRIEPMAQPPMPHAPKMPVGLPAPVHQPRLLRAPHLPATPVSFSPPTQAHDFRNGGTVPGTPNVPHNSYSNDTVPAKLSPGEVVVPLDAQKNDDDFESFMNQFKPSKKDKAPKISPDEPLDKLALKNLRDRKEK
jgi:hypothetical protein